MYVKGLSSASKQKVKKSGISQVSLARLLPINFSTIHHAHKNHPMKKPYFLLLFLCLIFMKSVQAQYRQYFDGGDLYFYSLKIITDTESARVWQIGRPQKAIFDSAATSPNVIMTDTINTYPANDSSRFVVKIDPAHGLVWGICAVRWKQKIDFDRKVDGGTIEFSADTGNTWHNVFGSPYVYNFYGFNTANTDTLENGLVGFTGTDTVWRDIWLCFDYSYAYSHGDIILRYTLVSDSVDSLREGWMIDNMSMTRTIAHTATKKLTDNDKIRVFPSPTHGLVYIEAPKIPAFHIIEQIIVTDINGREMKHYEKCPVKFFIDIGDLPPGLYHVRVKTNKYDGTFPITLVH